MTEDDIQSVCAVVVTFHPDPVVLRTLIEALAAQVGAIAVVDNTAGAGIGTNVPRVMQGVDVVLRQGKNVGLATAQNLGISWAREHRFSYVMLLDQDSEPSAGMVASLLEAIVSLRQTRKVAAVGPRFYDLHEARDAPFVRLGFFLNQKLRCSFSGQAVQCDFLISSGVLMPLDVVDQVGVMRDGLFIDNIDLEWSFRARAYGYELYGICAAQMQHRLGDSRARVLFGVGQIIVHSPIRLYYMMRNRVLLYGMPHTPRAWITQDMPRVVAKLFLFGVLIGPRLRNLRYMLRGLMDGFRGREGACPIAPD